LLLSLSIVAALAACNREAAAPAADASAAKASDAPKLTLDESKLPGVNTFQVSDLDTTKNVCADFNGYVNGKWLAANPIPGDRTSWGSYGSAR
jgi:putative endopeptidase